MERSTRSPLYIQGFTLLFKQSSNVSSISQYTLKQRSCLSFSSTTESFLIQWPPKSTLCTLFSLVTFFQDASGLFQSSSLYVDVFSISNEKNHGMGLVFSSQYFILSLSCFVGLIISCIFFWFETHCYMFVYNFDLLQLFCFVALWSIPEHKEPHLNLRIILVH